MMVDPSLFWPSVFLTVLYSRGTLSGQPAFSDRLSHSALHSRTPGPDTLDASCWLSLRTRAAPQHPGCPTHAVASPSLPGRHLKDSVHSLITSFLLILSSSFILLHSTHTRSLLTFHLPKCSLSSSFSSRPSVSTAVNVTLTRLSRLWPPRRQDDPRPPRPPGGPVLRPRPHLPVHRCVQGNHRLCFVVRGGYDELQDQGLLSEYEDSGVVGKWRCQSLGFHYPSALRYSGGSGFRLPLPIGRRSAGRSSYPLLLDAGRSVCYMEILQSFCRCGFPYS